MSKYKYTNIFESAEPHERLRHIINYSNAVQVDPHVPPAKYYRSGLEMVRMANVYYEEGNLENAYCLYLKFLTLFLEKIRKHPDFNTVPSNMKAVNQAKIREVLPRTEKLKERLLEIYKDEYEKYCLHVKKRQKEEEERKKREAEEAKLRRDKKDILPPPHDFITAKIPDAIDDLGYPDPSFPSPAPSRSKLEPTAPPEPPSTSSDFYPSIPSFDRTKKPTADLDKFDKYDSGALRSVIIPANVMVLFENMAESNTLKNLETCGILAGKLEKNQLIITHLIVPKQSGTADSCATTNEEELFDYQDQHNLITLGWIHTHPTQTAFLSSVDLHTHCPYQLLMPEAVAIVCSPKYKETGFFILTPNYGLQFIANCRKTGFHPHPTDPPLFKTAEHITIRDIAPLEVIDLRRK